MKIYSKLIALAVILFGIYAFSAHTMAKELIAPTRSKKGTVEQSGKLSVFSEPPGIEVLLDGTKIGLTPVIAKEIAPGTHVLKIQDKEAEIYISPGKALQYSWFKGSFREIPVKEEKDRKAPNTESATAKKEKKDRKSDQKEIELQPLYWPLNPRGPIF